MPGIDKQKNMTFKKVFEKKKKSPSETAYVNKKKKNPWQLDIR